MPREDHLVHVDQDFSGVGSQTPDPRPRKSRKGVKMTRPRGYSAELAQTICDRLAEGESLLTVLKARGMPGNSTVMRWLSDYPEFRALYEKARSFQTDILLDELREIADNANTDEPWRAYLRVHARKFMIGKMRLKKYGDNPCRTYLEAQIEPTRIRVITGVPDDGDGL